jgi:hypothetical protein
VRRPRFENNTFRCNRISSVAISPCSPLQELFIRRISKPLDDLLDRPREDRVAALDAACGSDLPLRLGRR